MKNKFCCCIMLTILSTIAIYSEENLSKEQQWEKISSEVDSAIKKVDKSLYLYLPADLRDLMVGLKAHHITSNRWWSGNGLYLRPSMVIAHPHLYIQNHLDNPKIVELHEEITQLHEKERTFFRVVEKKFPDHEWAKRKDDPDVKKYADVKKRCLKVNDELETAVYATLKPLQSLLISFYKQKDVPYDRMLVLKFNKEIDMNNKEQTQVILTTLGGEWEQHADLAEKLVKYDEYLTEMARFAAFLKEDFFTPLPK